MSKQSSQHVRVGIFVALALGVLIVTVFVVGQEHSLFSSKTHLYTSFADVNGLVVGAPVRLAGVDVGRVSQIAFSKDLNHAEARIELAIESAYIERVRRDSRAIIDSKGLLGDKIVNVTPGSPAEPRLQEGEYVQPKAGLSFESLAKQVEDTAAAIGGAAQEAQGAVGNFASPEIVENVRRTTAAMASILEEVAHGNGLAHSILYDPAYAARVSATLANLEQTTANARGAATRIDRILARVEHGPGTLNALVYGTDGSDMLGEWKRAAGGVADFTDQLNHGDGLAQALVRDPSGRKLVADMGEFATRLNHIAKHVEAGRGTVGGLLVDPSVYEEMKTVLGNIERSVVFKALVRATIQEDDMVRPVRQAKKIAPPVD
jgi:phospholipid/cholesterol/gamma-HCH transport system substrate-binding protein